MSKDFLNKLSHYKNKSDFTEKYNPPSIAALPTEDLRYKSVHAEYVEIMKVLEEENFNKTRSAKRLNINRKTLYNKIKTFNILNGSE